MVNPTTSRATRVAFAISIKSKLHKSLGDSRKIGDKEQGEGFNLGGIFQRERGTFITGDQNNDQISIE